MHKTYKYTTQMKTKRLLMLVFASAALLFASCTKETTYTFTNNMDMSDLQQYITDYAVYLSEYDATGSCVANNTIDSPSQGVAYEFTANSRAEKVKVYIKVKLQYGTTTSNWNRWVQQVYYLEEGKNVDIVVNGETIVGTSEP